MNQSIIYTTTRVSALDALLLWARVCVPKISSSFLVLCNSDFLLRLLVIVTNTHTVPIGEVRERINLKSHAVVHAELEAECGVCKANITPHPKTSVEVEFCIVAMPPELCDVVFFVTANQGLHSLRKQRAQRRDQLKTEGVSRSCCTPSGQTTFSITPKK